MDIYRQTTLLSLAFVFVYVAAVIDLYETKQSQVCEETVQDWCVEEHAMDMDIAVLQQVEELERRVTSASLQVKVSILLHPAFKILMISKVGIPTLSKM